MLRMITMILSLITVIAVQLTVNVFSINGKTTIEIMNRLPILFTPPSYVFGIWLLIYGFLVVWLFGFWRNQRQHSDSTMNFRATLFISSVLLTILTLLLWQYEYFYWTAIVMTALLVIIARLYFTYPKVENHLFERVPISIYFGWVIISFLELINYVLTFHEWGGWGISNSLWTVIFLTIATAIALHFMYHHRDFSLNAVFVWVFIGIVVKNGFDSLFVSIAALFLTFVISASFFLIRTKDSPLESSDGLK